MPNYKFNEDSVLGNLSSYIDGTYDQHYTNRNNDVQALDVYQARGTLTNTAIDNAIKYLMRYGKKDGLNQKDLLKAMHYLVIAMGNEELIEDAIIAYEPEILSAEVVILHGVQFDLYVTFTDGTQRKVLMNKILTKHYDYLRSDGMKFRDTFSFSPFLVQWDDYILDYTADELYSMGEKRDYVPRRSVG